MTLGPEVFQGTEFVQNVLVPLEKIAAKWEDLKLIFILWKQLDNSQIILNNPQINQKIDRTNPQLKRTRHIEECRKGGGMV